jgi:hypothetical protein
MEHNPSSKSSSHSASQEIIHLTWNPDIHYHTRKSLPLFPLLDQMDPHNTLFSQIHVNIIFHLWLGLPSGLFSSGFLTKNLYVFLVSPMLNLSVLYN